MMYLRLLQKCRVCLKTEFPREHNSEIHKNNFDSFLIKHAIPKDWSINMPFKIGIINSLENQTNLHLKINGVETLFLSIMVKAILGSLTSEFEVVQESDIGKNILDKKKGNMLKKEINEIEKKLQVVLL